ncbi:hypothetical protein [[Mycobacterium] nativiensis]|uniref:Uncharacterized protein n=1 Tax=[Mycobacterium] nativiensis TaxID=2855503 RepID=A0ABU5Y188_9MYCO|nr:hypothetical protein [Mycolicibacter sp. MYC340]MEB3034006.1 hypothetical protein [Mycolicibacter sp. MYC340]
MLDTISGLPAHPLLAHLVAILVPATALLAVLAVLWPAARRRIGGAALFVAAGTLVAIPLTTAAGSWLQPRVMMGGEVLQHHATLGGQLLVWSALLTIAMICWWALHTPLFADDVGALPPTVRRIGITLTGAGTLVFAAVSTWLVVRIGHTGAQSMWGGMAC